MTAEGALAGPPGPVVERLLLQSVEVGFHHGVAGQDLLGAVDDKGHALALGQFDPSDQAAALHAWLVLDAELHLGKSHLLDLLGMGEDLQLEFLRVTLKVDGLELMLAQIVVEFGPGGVGVPGVVERGEDLHLQVHISPAAVQLPDHAGVPQPGLEPVDPGLVAGTIPGQDPGRLGALLGRHREVVQHGHHAILVGPSCLEHIGVRQVPLLIEDIGSRRRRANAEVAPFLGV